MTKTITFILNPVIDHQTLLDQVSHIFQLKVKFRNKSLVGATNKRQRISKVQSKIDNSQKLATQGTQDEEKRKKQTQNNVLGTNIRKQTQTT